MGVKMNAYARIRLNRTHLFVRFERVGNGSRFDIVKDSFLEAFPLALWDEPHRSWCLPIQQLPLVKQWCNQVFGENRFLVKQDTTLSEKIQYEIFSDPWR